MKKYILAIASLSLMITVSSCSKDHEADTNDNTINIEERATALGFNSVDAYTNYVSKQCAIGNHENCEILGGNNHQACTNINHNGENHNGAAHQGTGHNNQGNGHGNGNHHN